MSKDLFMKTFKRYSKRSIKNQETLEAWDLSITRQASNPFNLWKLVYCSCFNIFQEI